jgi:hypothetical protein
MFLSLRISNYEGLSLSIKFFELVTPNHLKPVGLLLFEMAKSKQKPFPLLSLLLKMRFRFVKPAKLALALVVPA